MKITKGRLKEIIKEELSYISEGGNLQNTAKGAAMSLLDTAKAMEQAPSHEPASLYAQEVAKQANLIMDMLVDMEGGGGGSVGGDGGYTIGANIGEARTKRRSK